VEGAYEIRLHQKIERNEDSGVERVSLPLGHGTFTADEPCEFPTPGSDTRWLRLEQGREIAVRIAFVKGKTCDFFVALPKELL
jgi:hypothetical protein